MARGDVQPDLARVAELREGAGRHAKWGASAGGRRGGRRRDHRGRRDRAYPDGDHEPAGQTVGRDGRDPDREAGPDAETAAGVEYLDGAGPGPAWAHAAAVAVRVSLQDRDAAALWGEPWAGRPAEACYLAVPAREADQPDGGAELREEDHRDRRDDHGPGPKEFWGRGRRERQKPAGAAAQWAHRAVPEKVAGAWAALREAGAAGGRIESGQGAWAHWESDGPEAAWADQEWRKRAGAAERPPDALPELWEQLRRLVLNQGPLGPQAWLRLVWLPTRELPRPSPQQACVRQVWQQAGVRHALVQYVSRRVKPGAVQTEGGPEVQDQRARGCRAAAESAWPDP